MNIQRWKGLIWVGSAALGAFIVFYAYDFLFRKQAILAQDIPEKDLTEVLDGVKRPAEQKTDVVAYDAIKHVFHEHDWTGKERAKPVAQTEGEKPPPVTKVAVSQLLKVLAIKVDTARPERSVAYVKFVDSKLMVHTGEGDSILRPDERLFTPYQDIRVDSITGYGVVFAFDDPGREKETVETTPYTSSQRGDLGIVMVGPEGAISPQLQQQITVADTVAPWRPEQLTQLRKNEWQVGTGTLEELTAITPASCRVTSSTRPTEPCKPPRASRSRVAPDSIPAQAGLTEGEVLKSINGHKVTSVNDAISFVKANSNSTESWTAVFEKQGREVTRTYHSPPR
jgi:hypothetical protein